VEASYNISTVAMQVVRDDVMGTQCPGVQLGHAVLEGCKYGNRALQDVGVADEIVKWGYWFCVTRTVE
jgi:hypothetical protein